MNRRDPMVPGSASLYMQTGIAGTGFRSGPQTGLNVQSDANPLSSTSVGFEPTIRTSTIESRLPMEPPMPVAISPPSANLSAPSTLAPPAETVKRKRGRPRKYGLDGSVSLSLSTSLPTHLGTVTPTLKRGRRRPAGLGKKQQLASLGLSGSAGIGFTPHVITVAVGEDIGSKIMAFLQQGPRAICVLSAIGSVSTAALCQPETSRVSVTCKGLFEILRLSGSYFLTMDGGSCNRFGSLSVLLSSPDGRVIGGGVEGMLVAASPVQVILGSFVWGSPKTKSRKQAGKEVAIDADHQTTKNPLIPTTVPPSQSLAPTSSSGAWPDSQRVDIHNVHVNIDLMRG